MKAYISGTWLGRTVKSVDDIPGPVKEKLDDQMAFGTTFIVGDNAGIDSLLQEYLYKSNYKDVIVYSPGRIFTTIPNFGGWLVKICPVHSTKTIHCIRLEKDFMMTQDADYGILVWDEEHHVHFKDDVPFVNMVSLIAQKKFCHVYLIKTAEWVRIHSISDLESFAGSYGGLGDEDIHHILKRCEATCEEKIHYEYSNRGRVAQMLSVVLQSPIDLRQKLMLLQYIARTRNLKYEVYRSVRRCLEKNEDWDLIKERIRTLVDWKEEKSEWTTLRKTQETLSDILRLEFEEERDWDCEE